MIRMEAAEYQRLLKVEMGRLSAIDPSTLTDEIDHLDGWTVHSVVGHTAWLVNYVSECLQAPPDQAPPRSIVGEPPVGPAVLNWFNEAADRLEAVMGQADLAALHPTWTGPQPTLWWMRRLAHEISIHRWDAYSPSGRPEPIEAAQALDGIDEVLEVFVPNRLAFDKLAGAGETIHLHATDIDQGEWLLELLADDIRWEHTHAKGDVAARGSASELMLLMWSRITPDQIEVFGRAELLDRYQRAATF